MAPDGHTTQREPKRHIPGALGRNVAEKHTLPEPGTHQPGATGSHLASLRLESTQWKMRLRMDKDLTALLKHLDLPVPEASPSRLFSYLPHMKSLFCFSPFKLGVLPLATKNLPLRP